MSRVHDGYSLDEAYAHRYEVEVLIDSPSSKTIRRYGTGPGAHLKVHPADSPAFIYTVNEPLDRLQLVTWPDPDAFVVLPSAFLISTTDPAGSSKQLPGFDGLSVDYIYRLHEPIILIGHDWGIYCYDANGFRWKFEGIRDEPTIDFVGDDVILFTPFLGNVVLSLSTGKRQK